MALWQPKLDPLQISCDKSCCEWLHTHFKKGPLKACLLVLIRITEELTAEEPKEPSSFRSHITPKTARHVWLHQRWNPHLIQHHRQPVTPVCSTHGIKQHEKEVLTTQNLCPLTPAVDPH